MPYWAHKGRDYKNEHPAPILNISLNYKFTKPQAIPRLRLAKDTNQTLEFGAGQPLLIIRVYRTEFFFQPHTNSAQCQGRM
jgi:hypothetical protein